MTRTERSRPVIQSCGWAGNAQQNSNSVHIAALEILDEVDSALRGIWVVGVKSLRRKARRWFLTTYSLTDIITSISAVPGSTAKSVGNDEVHI